MHLCVSLLLLLTGDKFSDFLFASLDEKALQSGALLLTGRIAPVGAFFPVEEGPFCKGK